MKHGPVLSQTYDLIVAEEVPGEHSYWREHVSEPRDYTVRLRGEPPRGTLSPAQEQVLDEVFDEFGGVEDEEAEAIESDLLGEDSLARLLW